VDPAADPVAASLAALGQFFVGDSRLDETVQRVVDVAEAALSNASMTGITMMVEDRPGTAFFSDPRAPDIDQAQYSEGDGPCLHAFRHLETVRIDDLEHDERWPRFRDRAMTYGVRSTLSLALVGPGHEPVGALNFYSDRRSGFGEDDEELAGQFARQAATVLANARAYWDTHDLASRIQEGQAARAVIEQAKGMLMAASDVDDDRAFQMLVAASQRENRKLRDMAVEIVRRRGRPPAEEA
jgi:GAF domain-containing protein